MTTEAAHPAPDPIQIPWASVRLFAEQERPDAKCNRCGGKPLLEFRADYSVTGVTMPADDDEQPERKTFDCKVPLFACNAHAGELAFAAAYTVAAGPTGAV